MSAGQITGQGRLNERGIKPDIGLEETRQRRWQCDEPAGSRLFQEANRAHYGQPAMNGRRASRPIVHQDGGGMDFLCQTDGFQFARIHV